MLKSASPVKKKEINANSIYSVRIISSRPRINRKRSSMTKSLTVCIKDFPDGSFFVALVRELLLPAVGLFSGFEGVRCGIFIVQILRKDSKTFSIGLPDFSDVFLFGFSTA